VRAPAPSFRRFVSSSSTTTTDDTDEESLWNDVFGEYARPTYEALFPQRDRKLTTELLRAILTAAYVAESRGLGVDWLCEAAREARRRSKKPCPMDCFKGIMAQKLGYASVPELGREILDRVHVPDRLLRRRKPEAAPNGEQPQRE
jgi:hypothetical protein